MAQKETQKYWGEGRSDAEVSAQHGGSLGILNKPKKSNESRRFFPSDLLGLISLRLTGVVRVILHCLSLLTGTAPSGVFASQSYCLPWKKKSQTNTDRGLLYLTLKYICLAK